MRYRVVTGAGIVSRHRKLARALEALERQRRGARAQGGWVDLEEWDPSAGRWRTWHEPDPGCRPGEGRPPRFGR